MRASRSLPVGRSLVVLSFSLLLAALAASPAQATLLISNQATQNIKCKNGICKATAHFAILNAGDLAGMLASGDVTVLAGLRAMDVELKVPLSWASAHRLTLDAYRSILIDRSLTVAGSGALTMTTNDGGSGGDLFFNGTGRAIFWDLHSSLISGGLHYMLVGSLADLAAAVATNQYARVALANNYDAGGDGVYATSPVVPRFSGYFEGLGNTIENMSIQTPSDSTDSSVGLFSDLYGGRVRDLRMKSAHIVTLGSSPQYIGLLGGAVVATLTDDEVAGTIQADCCTVGGLVADMNSGTVIRSSANVRITGTAAEAGGLVGSAGNGATISFSHAGGNVTATNTAGGLIAETSFIGSGAFLLQDFATGAVNGGTAGGLVGLNDGNIDQSYATGAVSGAGNAGGFVGENDFKQLTHNYAIGHVGGTGSLGGFSGCSQTPASFDYWDTDTAGVNVGDSGCADSDLTIGLTTAQFQSGLPNGFDPAIWAEDPAINNGFPYLIANPPQ